MTTLSFNPSATLVDTQIVSLAFKGQDDAIKLVASCNIASITAAEFLLSQSTEKARPEYVALPVTRYSGLEAEGLEFDNERWGNKKWAKSSYRKTDQFVIDFGTDFPIFLEYGNRSMSTIINSRRKQFYRFCISHLDKSKQKYLLKRFEYLCQQEVSCIPLTKEIGNLGLEAMKQFLTEHNPKANIKNTVNDILIAATARVKNLTLVSRDNLLNRFAGSFFGGDMVSSGPWLRITFDGTLKTRRKMSESKGYLNSSWRVKVLRGQD